jgi:death on curing protein
MIIYLSRDQILEIHRSMIRLYGGSDGVRDPVLLDSALAAPKAGFGGDFFYKTVPEIAAVYLFHLCQNHPFIDGNKRVAAGAAMVFADENGWSCRLTQDELADYTLQVASSQLSKAALTVIFEHTLIPPADSESTP